MAVTERRSALGLSSRLPSLTLVVVISLSFVVAGGCKNRSGSGNASKPQDKTSSGSAPSEGVEPAQPAREGSDNAKEASARPKDLIQVPMGGNGSEPPGLAFRITKIFKDRKPIPKTPWHAEGGKWSFFEAKAADAFFVFGVTSQPLQGVSFERATAVLVTASPKDRTAFLRAMGKAFRAPATDVEQSRPVRPFRLSGVILNRSGTRIKGGGFQGGGGSWITSKFTIEGKKDSAEVFINWNPVEKIGEFSEKDASFRKPLLKLMTKAMLDGKPD